jgi:hypothetical protein
MAAAVVGDTIVTYNQAATKLAGLERQWQAAQPAKRGQDAFERSVMSAEDVLAAELAAEYRR